MSRAQQLKSGDISLGLAHEWVCAFGRQGGTSAMLQQAIEDVGVMQRIVTSINGEPQAAPEQDAVMQALMAAVEKGVQCENGVYRFFDPGIPLVTLRNLPVVRQKKFVYVQDWYDRYEWAKREDVQQERTLRIPVKGSFNKDFADQEKLLTADEEVASTRSVATFLVINALSTGKRLLPDHYVRCIDKDSDGNRVFVGDFVANGLDVNVRWDDRCHPIIGVAAARKS